MDKYKLLIIGFLLISSLAYGQEDKAVEVYKGRGNLFQTQKILDLSYRGLNELPAESLNPEIEILILDNNNIEELPPWIQNLKNLKMLSVRNNNLLKLDQALANCRNLEQLYLSGNKDLIDISCLSLCEKLEIIDVVDTKINELPGWISMMNSLFYFKFTIVR